MRHNSNHDSRLEELRTTLLDERSRLLGDRLRHLQVLTAPENTAAEDQVPLLHDQFVAIKTTSRNLRKLALIDSALDRLARGEFGMCKECEEEIPIKRLRAIPWASHCVGCQERLESISFRKEEALAASP